MDWEWHRLLFRPEQPSLPHNERPITETAAFSKNATPTPTPTPTRDTHSNAKRHSDTDSDAMNV